MIKKIKKVMIKEDNCDKKNSWRAKKEEGEIISTFITQNFSNLRVSPVTYGHL